MAVMAGVWVAAGWVFTGGAVAVAACWLGRGSRGWRVVLVGFFLLAAGRAWWIEQEKAEVRAELGLEDGSVLLRGQMRVGSLMWPGSASEARVGFLQVKNGPDLRVALEGGDWEAAGVYEVRGRLFPAAPPRNPGEVSREELWEGKGVTAGFSADGQARTGTDWKLLWVRWAEASREGLRERITRGTAPEGEGRQVIQAMVLGETPARDSELIKAFRHSGALHVFAVSGLHVTLVGLIAWWACRMLRRSRRQSVVIIILAMVAYALITGARPPAVRASLMGAVFLSAFLLRRRPSVMNALGLAVICSLLWRPGQLFDMGFQLSYGVVAAIIIGVGFFQDRTRWLVAVDPFLPEGLLNGFQAWWLGVREKIRGLVATSAAAWVGSFPLMLWHFGLVAPVAILSGVVLITATLVILALALGGAAIGWGPLRPVAELGNRANERVAEGAYGVAKGFAAIPGGHFYAGKGAPAEVVIFDVGDGGAATWIEAGGGVLLDAGSERNFRRVVAPCLLGWRVEPDSVVLSHGDGQHVGGMAEALEKFPVRQVLVPVDAARSPMYRAVTEVAGDRALVGKGGVKYEIEPGVWLEVVLGAEEGEGWLADDSGMVLRLNWHGWRVLFMGDAGLRRERELLECGRDFSAEVVVMGRHLSGGSGGLALLEAAGAKAVICSVADYPAYERLPEGWAERTEAAGIRAFCQDRSGAVLLHLEENEMRVESFMEGGGALRLER